VEPVCCIPVVNKSVKVRSRTVLAMINAARVYLEQGANLLYTHLTCYFPKTSNEIPAVYCYGWLRNMVYKEKTHLRTNMLDKTRPKI